MSYPQYLATQDTDKPFILGDDPNIRPFVVVFRGERYELPGEVPVAMTEKAISSAANGQDEQAMAAVQVIAFLSDVCPVPLAEALRKSGTSALNRLFDAWAEHAGLGENSAS